MTRIEAAARRLWALTEDEMTFDEAKAANDHAYQWVMTEAKAALDDEPTALDALQAVANLPTGKNEDVMEGQEQAYRAIEALYAEPPEIKGERSQTVLDTLWLAIRVERQRQIDAEGYDAEHDDAHDQEELLIAASCYRDSGTLVFAPKNWPWNRRDWKASGSAFRNLTRAGALCLAERDRLKRAGLATEPADFELGKTLLAALDLSTSLPSQKSISNQVMTTAERICFDRAMEQWTASLSREDLDHESRVKGALLAYQRQAFVMSSLGFQGDISTPPTSIDGDATE